MTGIVGAADSRRDYPVVARALGLAPELSERQPCQGVEPVNGAREPTEQLCQMVATRDVSELVCEDEAPPVGGPRFGIVRQDDHGTEHAPGER